MAVLSPHVPYDVTETVLSYAARLSSVHTGMTIRRLLDDLDLGRDRFVNGKPAVRPGGPARAADADGLSRIADPDV